MTKVSRSFMFIVCGRPLIQRDACGGKIRLQWREAIELVQHHNPGHRPSRFSFDHYLESRRGRYSSRRSAMPRDRSLFHTISAMRSTMVAYVHLYWISLMLISSRSLRMASIATFAAHHDSEPRPEVIGRTPP